MTPHRLPALPYGYDALEPWVDEQTLRVHYEQHHRELVNRLNEAETRLEALQSCGDLLLIQMLQQRACKLACAHFLHCLFWEVMGPNQTGIPAGRLADQLNEDFGSFAAFKARFSAAALSIQSGGWVVLVWRLASQQLAIVTAEGGTLPAGWVTAVVLALDVCEHAYYRKYEHRRAEYVHNWWNAVNWPRVAQLFACAIEPQPLPQLRATSHGSPAHDNRTLRTALATATGHARHLLRAG